MDNKPVRNSAALENLNIAIAHLILTGVALDQKGQSEQARAADALLDSAVNLRKQVTK